MLETQQNSLLIQIQKKAETEAAEIIAQSKERLHKKAIELEEQKKLILEKGQKDIQDQLSQMERTLHSRIEMEKRHSHLKEQELVMQDLKQRVYRHMRALIGKPEYVEILIDWICEAALALPENDLIVQTSPEELPLLTSDVLQKAADLVAKLGAQRQVHFTLDKENLLLGQGVVVRLANNKLLFSNTVTDRMTRRASDIRSYVFEKIFKTDALKD